MPLNTDTGRLDDVAGTSNVASYIHLCTWLADDMLRALGRVLLSEADFVSQFVDQKDRPEVLAPETGVACPRPDPSVFHSQSSEGCCDCSRCKGREPGCEVFSCEGRKRKKTKSKPIHP